MTEFAGTTVRQSDATEPLANIYPLKDVDALTVAQEAALEEATRDAMRPLVEAAWGRRGATVKWTAEPRFGNAGILLPSGLAEYANDDALALADDLADAEVAVWGEAYEKLDTDVLWAQVVGVGEVV